MNKKLISIIMAGIISITTLCQAFPISSFAYSSYQRIAGKNRYLTSEYVSARNKSKTVILASGEKFPDALSAVNLSNKYDAATILTDGRSYSIVNILKSRGAEKVFLMGGVSSISADLERKIRQEGFNVERISGINRYETSKNAVKRAGYTSVGVASGENYTDALAAAPLLKQENSGLMLVDGRGYTVPSGVTVKYTFGGSRSIPQNGGERIYGVSRFETAIKISNKVKNPRTMAVVSGDNFADALSATNLVVSDDAIIMPVQKYPYYDVIRKAREVNEVIFVGGVNSISNETASRIIEKGITPDVKPSAGDDFDTAKLTPDQKQLLNDIEDMGNTIVDDIEEAERIANEIKALKPQINNGIENIKKIQDVIHGLDLSGGINGLLNNIDNVEKIIDALTKGVSNTDQVFKKFTEIKAKFEKIKAEINKFNTMVEKLLNQAADQAVKHAINQLQTIIHKKINELLAGILKEIIGI